MLVCGVTGGVPPPRARCPPLPIPPGSLCVVGCELLFHSELHRFLRDDGAVCASLWMRHRGCVLRVCSDEDRDIVVVFLGALLLLENVGDGFIPTALGQSINQAVRTCAPGVVHVCLMLPRCPLFEAFCCGRGLLVLHVETAHPPTPPPLPPPRMPCVPLGEGRPTCDERLAAAALWCAYVQPLDREARAVTTATATTGTAVVAAASAATTTTTTDVSRRGAAFSICAMHQPAISARPLAVRHRSRRVAALARLPTRTLHPELTRAHVTPPPTPPT